MPKAVKLDGINSRNQNRPFYEKKLLQLIHGSFFTYNFNGSELRQRTLNRLLNKKHKNGTFLFDQFLSDHEFSSFRGTTLGDFVEFTGFKLIFWAGQRYTNSTVKAAEISSDISVKNIHFLVPAAYRNTITKYFEIKNLPELSIIYNAEAVETMVNGHNPNKTIVEMVSDKSGKSIGEVEFLLNHHFPNGIPFRNERKFCDIFNFGFQISGVSGSQDQESGSAPPAESIEIFKESYSKDFMNLEWVGQWQGANQINYTDTFRLSRAKLFFCPNKWCTLPGHHRKDFIDKHIETCTNMTKFNYKHKSMVSEASVREFLAENDFLPLDYSNNHFATEDAETLGVQDNIRDNLSANSVELAEHKIVTLAFSSTFAPDKVFERDSFSEDDYHKFYTEVCAYIEHLGKEYLKTLPQKVFDSFHRINAILSADQKRCESENPTIQSAEKLDPHMKAMLSKGRRYLKKLMTLKIYGFGSERFDHPLILPGLLSVWKLKQKDVQVISRSAGYMKMRFNIKGQEIAFQDARLYAGSGSLSKFAKTFGAEGSKGLFCYEYFKSIPEAIACTEWPSYDKFKSSLKYPNDRDIDARIRKAFELVNNELDYTADQFLAKMNIPSHCYQLDPDPNRLPVSIDYEAAQLHLTVDPVLYIENLIEYENLFQNSIVRNMFDFLKWYNIQDCVILKQALQGFSDLFHTNLEINPLEHTTLPGMAEKVMWNYFDDKIGGAFSLAEREINLMIRNSSMGGLTAIIDGRHQEINVDPNDRVYPAKVYTTPNGQTIVKCESLDYNNLYGYSMVMPMPVGHAIHYKLKQNGLFSWQPVQNPDKFSLDAIEWLNFQQSKFLKVDGSRHVIKHAMNFGEVEIKAGETRTDSNLIKHKIYKPDGYVEVDGTKHFFEFDGCHHHECPHKCSVYQRFRNRPSEKRWSPRSVEDRNAFYRSQGILHTITSCQWYRMRNTVTYKNYSSVFFRRNEVSESEILDKVVTGDFFGLIKCDVHSPDHVIDFFKGMSFGPVFLHKTVDPDSIHPEYVDILNRNKRSFPLDPVLTVGYHGKDLLLTTEFVKYYLKIGMEVTNVTEALEYEQDNALADFVNHVTNERKKATEAGNNALQNIFKLVMNSSYGYGAHNHSEKIYYS